MWQRDPGSGIGSGFLDRPARRSLQVMDGGQHRQHGRIGFFLAVLSLDNCLARRRYRQYKDRYVAFPGFGGLVGRRLAHWPAQRLYGPARAILDTARPLRRFLNLRKGLLTLTG